MKQAIHFSVLCICRFAPWVPFLVGVNCKYVGCRHIFVSQGISHTLSGTVAKAFQFCYVHSAFKRDWTETFHVSTYRKERSRSKSANSKFSQAQPDSNYQSEFSLDLIICIYINIQTNFLSQKFVEEEPFLSSSF